MSDKYIATVETNQQREKACAIGEQILPSGGTYTFEITSREAAQNFIEHYAKIFPESKYRLYRLEEEKDEL